ncbi:hypothetical protein ACFL33_02120 [Pseudomonadota bacterium]
MDQSCPAFFPCFFPRDRVLVIDNNPEELTAEWSDVCRIETEWVKSQPGLIHVVNEQTPKRHGLAMDLAARITGDLGFNYMLHFEPDCLICGTNWFSRLKEGARDMWMVGCHLKDYGPIHPTPSIWDVNEIKTSFEVQPRGADQKHPRFGELFDLGHLHTRVLKEGDNWDWWGKYWDTAQRAWFLAAVEDKAKLVPKADDFIHFWGGSNPARRPESFKDPNLEKYLRD